MGTSEKIVLTIERIVQTMAGMQKQINDLKDIVAMQNKILSETTKAVKKIVG